MTIRWLRCVLCGRPEDEATPSFSTYLHGVDSRCPECGKPQGVDHVDVERELAELRTAIAEAHRRGVGFPSAQRMSVGRQRLEETMTDERLDEIKTKWNFDVAAQSANTALRRAAADIGWLVGEVERLRAEAKRADEEATKLANSDLATTEQVVRALRVENAALRAKVRTITEHYKPGWVDGLKAVARSAGFDPDDAPHDGVDPPSFIEDVIDLLRRDVRDLKAENERLRAALEAVMGACDAECAGCGAYYVAKRALNGEKE